jgi:sec-independent protein translocase protein TatA
MGLENPLHILMLLLIVTLVFGARRLPELGRSLGEGMRGFRDSLHGEAAELPPPPQAPHAGAG